MKVRYFVTLGEQELQLDVERTADGSHRVRTADGREFSVSSLANQPGERALLVSGQVIHVQLAEGHISLRGERFPVRAESERARGATRAVSGETPSSKEIVAPMPGRIVRVSCEPGSRVQKGAPLVVIEAMKMQNELCAKADEVVRAVRVASGDAVDRGAVLIEFE
jgi:acetyl/propionyl-CoA carboxylase alpha subunit